MFTGIITDVGEILSINLDSGKIKISSNVTKPYSRFVKKPLNLTYARNALLHYVETNYSHFDYMIMVDLDSLEKNFKPT